MSESCRWNMFFDTHTHLDEEILFKDLDNVLLRSKNVGVSLINSVGTSWDSSLLNVHIAEKYSQIIYASIGIHPSEAEILPDMIWEKLFDLSKSPKVVAWGEIGLDYFYSTPAREIQKKILRKQITLAKEAGLPIIIHNREAHQDILTILREEKAGINGGIMHCFSGSWEVAKQCLNMNFMISFAGPLTYLNARLPIEVAERVPLDMLLLETDSPYLSPHPLRGKVNEPSRIIYTAEKLANIKNLTMEKIAEITSENAMRIFSI